VALRLAVATPAIPTAAAAKSVTANTEERCPAPTSSTVGELAKPRRLLNAYLNCWSSLFVLQGPQQEGVSHKILTKPAALGLSKSVGYASAVLFAISVVCARMLHPQVGLAHSIASQELTAETLHDDASGLQDIRPLTDLQGFEDILFHQ
jgi:hypothetical protein